MAFGYYSPVTVQSGQVPSTQTDFPMLISQTDNRFKTVANGGHVQNSSGFDIRPYSDSGLTSALTYELERYNGTTGEVVMWVKIASLAVGSVVYLAYGDSALTTNGSNGSGTFSNNFISVYHLKDGTTLSVVDSLAAHNGTNNGATAAAGKVDGGGGFVSASSQYINIGSYAVSAATTMSAWVNATSFPNSYNSVIFKNNANTNYQGILVKSNGKISWTANNPTVTQDGTGTNTLSSATWYYLVMTYDSTVGLVGYVNASSDATHAANGVLAGTEQSDIGRDNVNAGRFWNGTLDEVRIASVVRSANWITTEYNNQNAPGTFETLGTEVTSGGPTVVEGVASAAGSGVVSGVGEAVVSGVTSTSFCGGG